MPIDQLSIASHPAFAPGAHDRAGAAPTFTTGLLEEIRWLRRELRHQQDRADQNIRYERDRARIIALDAEQARRRADALDCEVAAKNIELITLQVRLDDLQSRLAAQKAAHRRREATRIPRTRRSSRSQSRTPDKWLRPETLVSGLIGMYVGSRLAVWTSGPADTAEPSPDETQATAADPRTTDQTQAIAADSHAADTQATDIEPHAAETPATAADPHVADQTQATAADPQAAAAEPRAADRTQANATDPHAAVTQATAAGPLSAAAHDSPPEAADPHDAEDPATPVPPDETQTPSTDPLAAGANESPLETVDPPVAEVHAAPLHTCGATPDPRAADDRRPSLVTISAPPEPCAADDPAAPIAIGAKPEPRATDHNAAPLATHPRADHERQALRTGRGTLSPRRRPSARKVNARHLTSGARRRHRSTPRSRGPPVRPPGR